MLDTLQILCASYQVEHRVRILFTFSLLFKRSIWPRDFNWQALTLAINGMVLVRLKIVSFEIRSTRLSFNMTLSRMLRRYWSCLTLYILGTVTTIHNHGRMVAQVFSNSLMFVTPRDGYLQSHSNFQNAVQASAFLLCKSAVDAVYNTLTFWRSMAERWRMNHESPL